MQVKLPEGRTSFPQFTYKFANLSSILKYWLDVQFICLNTPLGLVRAPRPKKSEEVKEEKGPELKEDPEEPPMKKLKSARVARTFNTLRDFQVNDLLTGYSVCTMKYATRSFSYFLARPTHWFFRGSYIYKSSVRY